MSRDPPGVRVLDLRHLRGPAGESDQLPAHQIIQQYHNVFSGFEMIGFDSSLNNVTGSIVTPERLESVVPKRANTSWL